MSPTAPGGPIDLAVREAALGARCAELVELALRRGADEAEAYASREETVAVRFEKGDLKLAQVDEGATLGLRVLRAGRLGFCSTNQLDDAALARAAADALSLAALSLPDEHNGLPDPRPIDVRPSLVRPAALELGVESAVDAAARMVATVRALDPRLSIDNASLEVRRTTRAVRSSRGVAAQQSDARLRAGLFGMAVDGADVGGFESLGEGLRDPAQLDEALCRRHRGEKRRLHFVAGVEVPGLERRLHRIRRVDHHRDPTARIRHVLGDQRGVGIGEREHGERQTNGEQRHRRVPHPRHPRLAAPAKNGRQHHVMPPGTPL